MKTFPFKYHKPAEYIGLLSPNNWINFLLEEINPMNSRKRIMSQITSVHLETDETKTLVLRNKKKGFTFSAGQHLPLTVEINGKRVVRYYSISSAPYEKDLRITIKRQKQGLVSNFVHESLRLGDFVEIGVPTGNFILPEIVPSKLLFVVGGSGITPVYSILKTLGQTDYNGDVKVIYFSRKPEEIIFHQELKTLQEKHSFLNIEFILTDTESKGFRTEFVSQELLEELVTDYKERLTYLCGPGSLQEVVRKLIPLENLISENFQPFLNTNKKKDSKQVEVTLSKSHKKILLNGTKNLLEELEDNGIYPQSGCRMGICHTCACTKKSGTVTNLQEDSVSHTGEEVIQLCLSRAEENLELDI